MLQFFPGASEIIIGPLLLCIGLYLFVVQGFGLGGILLLIAGLWVTGKDIWDRIHNAVK